VALGDFNEDGALDVVTADRTSVSLLLGGGDGTLGAPDTFSYWTDPLFYVNSVAAADVDADGHADMLVAVSGGAGSFLSARLGEGDGTFADPIGSVAGQDAFCPGVADFDGDGVLDAAVANLSSGTVTVLEGLGDGTFGARRVETGERPRYLFVGDLNNDAHLDLVTVNDVPSSDDDTVSVHLGHGDGTFGAPAVYPAPVRPYTVNGGDFDGDGLVDLVVGTSWGLEQLWFMRNLGGGAFGVPGELATEAGGNPFQVADLDLDGHLDVVGPNAAGDRLIVALGNPDGTFQDEVVYLVHDGPRAVWVGDFDGDGWPDLADASAGDDSVSVLLNAGDGTFGGVHDYPTGDAPSRIFGADLNGDGSLDLATANVGDGSVSVLLGYGDGTFAAPGAFPVGFVADPEPNAITGADVNNDGHLDLVVSSDQAGAVSVLPGLGDGTFGPSMQFAAGSLPQAIAAADFNEDGQPDLAYCDYSDNAVGLLIQGRPMPWRSEIIAPRRSGHIVAGASWRSPPWGRTRWPSRLSTRAEPRIRARRPERSRSLPMTGRCPTSWG